MHALSGAINNIRLRPGDCRPGDYEALSEEERETLRRATRIFRKITIKHGENIEPVKIH